MPQVTAVKFSSPTVCVLMITYNHGPYIKRAISSILSQEVDFGVELVIGEDCSTDGTREVVLDFHRRFPDHIRLITSDCNVGMLANCVRTENGLRGKYGAYCEGDDCWSDPRKLARQVAFLEARPDYVLVHSHCHRYLVGERRLLREALKVTRGLSDADSYRDLLIGRRLIMTLTVMARADKLSRVLAECPECRDPRWPMGDTQRWLELSRHGKVGCIHEPLATKNMLDESASSSRDPKKVLRFLLAARDLHLHYLSKYPIDADTDRLVRRKQALAVLRQAYRALDSETARAMLSAYMDAGGTWNLTAQCLCWASHSGARQRVVEPLLRIDGLLRRLRRRMMPAALQG